MNILLEEQAKIGRIIKKTIWGILPLVSLSFVMQSCDENKFPVTPVPDQFEFIPPMMLTCYLLKVVMDKFR